MKESSVIIIAVLLGSHFFSGYVQDKVSSTYRRFCLGVCYALFAAIIFFIAAISVDSSQEVISRLGSKGILIGGLIYAIFTGFHWARPDI